MDELSEDDRTTVNRARKVQKYLSQPFFVTADSTGYEPKYVSIEKSVQAFGEIVSGSLDHVPEQHFFMKGDINDIYKSFKQ
jgi:F-type H+-transporting ATPase subunit beta